MVEARCRDIRDSRRNRPFHELSAIDNVPEWEKNGAQVLKSSPLPRQTIQRERKVKIMVRAIGVDLTEIRKLTVLGLAMLALGGLCSGQANSSKADWTQFLRSNMQRYNPYEHVLNVKNVSQLKVKWTYATVSGVDTAPAVADGVVYVCAGNGIYAIDAGSGGTVWSTSVGDYSATSPAIAQGEIYFANGGNVYALDAKTGIQIWTYGNLGYISGFPTVVDGVVYIATQYSTVDAFDAQTGTVLWSFMADDATFYGGPAVADGLVYVSANNKGDYIYALDARTGTEVWSYSTYYGGNISPAVADGIVYVPPEDGNVYALDARTGALVWRREVPGGRSFAPAVANGVLYVGGMRLFALNAKTGAVLWKYGKVGRNTPAVANGVVYIPCRKKSICALDARTGVEIWRYATHGSVNFASVVDGVLYVTSDDRNVYAFSLQ